MIDCKTFSSLILIDCKHFVVLFPLMSIYTACYRGYRCKTTNFLCYSSASTFIDVEKTKCCVNECQV